MSAFVLKAEIHSLSMMMMMKEMTVSKVTWFRLFLTLLTSVKDLSMNLNSAQESQQD